MPQPYVRDIMIIPRKPRERLTHETENKGLIMILSGAVMISFSAVFVKLAHVGPTVSAFYRMAFGGIILFGIALLSKKLQWKGWKALGVTVVCALFFSIDLTIWHRSIHYVGPGLATILANFQVFFLAAAGIAFSGESLTTRYILSVFIALFGLTLLIVPGSIDLSKHFYLGVFLGISAAVAYAAYLLTLRFLKSREISSSPLQSIAVISVLTAAFLGIEGLFEQASFVIPDNISWVSLVAYGITGQVFGWVLISKGIALVKTSRAGLVLLLQPTLAFIWDILFFHRPTHFWDIIGAILAITAIYLGSSHLSSVHKKTARQE